MPELQLKVDRQVDYGRVASVLALASQQGLHKLAFVSQPESALSGRASKRPAFG